MESFIHRVVAVANDYISGAAIYLFPSIATEHQHRLP